MNVSEWSHSDTGKTFHVGPKQSCRDGRAPSLWQEQPELHVPPNVESDGQRRLVSTWATGRRALRRADS